VILPSGAGKVRSAEVLGLVWRLRFPKGASGSSPVSQTASGSSADPETASGERFLV